MIRTWRARALGAGLVVAVLAGGLAGCSLLGLSPEPAVPRALAPEDLVGEWAEWGAQGATGLLYVFQADGTVTVIDLVSNPNEALLTGTYAVDPGGRTITVELTEPTLGLSLGETIWAVVSATREELRFRLPDGGELLLRRLR